MKRGISENDECGKGEAWQYDLFFNVFSLGFP